MKKSVLLLFIAAMAMGAIAGSVSSEMAVAAANAWAAKNGQFNAGTRATGVVSVRDPENGAVLWHQVSMQGGGMLVMAPVTEIEPVVMALDNDPGELPAAHPLRGILTGDMRRRLRFLGLYSAAPSGGASFQSVAPAAPESEISEEARAWGEASRAKWARLTGASFQEAESVGLTEVAVEVKVVPGFEKGGVLTHWNQGEYNKAKLFNLYTPSHAVCGCVATACSALAQFYGTTNALDFSNTCSYNGVKGVYKTRAGAVDWSILPENWGGTNAAIKATENLTTDQQDLIARVAYNAGVGVSMQWSDDESGAAEKAIVTALKEVFGFKNARAVDISPADSPDEEQLAKLMYNQVRAGVPVGFSIEGHSVVAVGYGLDSDNVQRVRVFMGWGGAGDGWYALPKIDTKATMNGGTYLSEIVDCIVTMISYDDDDIVPVVGHVSMPGAKLQVPALDREIESNDYGYFGTRVPFGLPETDCKVTCQGKEATFEIGADAADSDDAAALTEALPDAFEFALLNCTVAYSPKRAKLLALREGKAILRVSGTSVEARTAAVLDLIYGLDEANTDDFTNKFVYVFSSSSSAEGDGADVTYGVYLPEMFDPASRWQQPDAARLAWGYSVTISKATNSTHNVDHEEVESASTNVFTYTYAPATADPVATTNAVDEVDAVREGVLQSFQEVLAIGGRRFDECVSGIKVTVAATSEEAMKAIDKVALPENTCGLHENIYAPGSHTFVCDAVVTNEAAGLVMGCAGWSITNATTGAVLSGAGSEATLDLATNDVITLTWDFSKVIAVRVEVAWSDSEKLNDPETVTPGTGWYAYGEPVVFEAKENVNGFGFNKWKGADNKDIPESAVPLATTKILLPMIESGTLYAYYRKGTYSQTTETVTLSVKATSWFLNGTLKFDKADADAAPLTSVYGADGETQVGSGASVEVEAAGSVYVNAGATEYVDASGKKWVLYGCVVQDVTGDEDALDLKKIAQPYNAFTMQAVAGVSAVFNWLWIPDTSDPGTDFVISWDDALSTLNAHGYSTNLVSAADVEKYGIEIGNVKVTAPKGFTVKLATNAAGDIVATLELDEEVLQPVGLDGASSPLTIVSNGDGTVTVKADVANGVRGFWYSLYATDELGGTWTVVTTGYQAGNPSVQATVDDVTVSLSIDVEPTDAKKFYKLVVTDVKP